MKRLALAILIATAAMAQQQQPDYDGGDAPDHGVARLSFMNGNVSVYRGDSGEMVDGVLNAPLTATDRVVTAEGARAEVQFDAANLIRLGPATEVRLSELEYGRFQIQVALGTTSFRVLQDSGAQVEISTPSVSVRPSKKGIYRVTVRPDGSSEITVRSGEAEIFSPRGSEQLGSGKTMLSRGNASDPEFQVVGEYAQDDFDRWAANRDKDLERSQSARYVSPDVYGTEDLDGNGRWANDPEYGNVWVPNVDPDWAPYRCGRWTWIDYYGWTWVGCESWGWAPYHYGNWYRGSLGWAWYPGAIHSRYYWRPALVGFFGWGGGGVGVGFEFGNVGWVPLAPHERYRPWYGRGVYGGYRNTTVINNVTVVNNTNLGSVYRNARYVNGITGVRSNDFGRVSINRNNYERVTANDISRAGMVRGQLPLAPSRESTRFTNRDANTRGLPHVNENQHFVTRNAPARVERVPFEQQRQGVQRNITTPQQATGGVSGGAPAQENRGGWRRFDPSSRGAAQPSVQQPQGNSGFRRFEGNSGRVQGGELSPGARSAEPAPAQNNGGFRRFDNNNRSEQPRSEAPAAAPAQNNGGFRRFDNNNRGDNSAPGAETPRGDNNNRREAPDRNFSPRQQSQPAPSRGFGSRQQEPVRISPPIIQNRGNSGGGGARSAPRNEGGGNRGGGNRGGGERGGGHHGR
jgi:Family of unknown function (DUF6600)/FecR protein